MAGFAIGAGVADAVELYVGAMIARGGCCGHWLAAHGREVQTSDGTMVWQNGPCTHAAPAGPTGTPQDQRRCPCTAWSAAPPEDLCPDSVST